MAGVAPTFTTLGKSTKKTFGQCRGSAAGSISRMLLMSLPTIREKGDVLGAGDNLFKQPK